MVRERHPIPTVDEILHYLNTSTVFVKLEKEWAFHQVELSEEWRPITTFVTHKGLLRYKRLMFGISCAPEMYQRVMQQALEGCEGVRNMHAYDDMIVHEKTAEQASSTGLRLSLWDTCFPHEVLGLPKQKLRQSRKHVNQNR